MIIRRGCRSDVQDYNLRFSIKNSLNYDRGPFTTTLLSSPSTRHTPPPRLKKIMHLITWSEVTMLLLLPKILSCLISVEVSCQLCLLVHKKAAIKIKHCKFVQFAGLPEGLPLQLIHVKRLTMQQQWLLHSTLSQWKQMIEPQSSQVQLKNWTSHYINVWLKLQLNT